MGNSYNLKATIDASNVGGTEEGSLYPIEFTVSVEEWKEYTNVDALAILENKVVAENEIYTMQSDAVIQGTLKLAGELDGANHTLSAQSVPTNNGMIRPTGTAIIRNLTIDGNNAKTADGKVIRGLYINTGAESVTIDNVKILNCGYALNVGGEGAPTALELKVSNSTFQSWTSYGVETTATFTNVTFIKGLYANFKPYGETTVTNCEFTNVTLDFSALAEPITFDGCTVNGVALTEANVASVSEAYEAKKDLITIK